MLCSLWQDNLIWYHWVCSFQMLYCRYVWEQRKYCLWSFSLCVPQPNFKTSFYNSCSLSPAEDSLSGTVMLYIHQTLSIKNVCSITTYTLNKYIRICNCFCTAPVRRWEQLFEVGTPHNTPLHEAALQKHIHTHQHIIVPVLPCSKICTKILLRLIWSLTWSTVNKALWLIAHYG